MYICLLFVLSPAFGAGVNQFIPQVVDSINVEVVQEKNTGYLNCTMVLEESQMNQASWYYGEKQISIGSKLLEPVRIGLYGLEKYQARFFPGRPDFAPNMPGMDVDRLQTYQLEIRFADITDNGMYRCVLEIKSLPRRLWPEAYGRLVVTQAPIILPGLASKIVDEGDSLTWVCQAHGSAQLRVSWTRANGRPLNLPGSPQRIYNETLHIPRVNRFDRGIYRCHAANNVYGSTEYDVMLEVNYKPQIRLARYEGAYGQKSDSNYDVIMECIVNGYPDPDLLWFKGVYDPKLNNIPLYDSAKYELEKTRSYGAVGTNVTDVISLLKVKNIRESDYGNYTCMAANRYGMDMTVTYIFCKSIQHLLTWQRLPRKVINQVKPAALN
eukprot:TsM_000341000 transcript=TsM_000341000 gene=TsM_000341000